MVSDLIREYYTLNYEHSCDGGHVLGSLMIRDLGHGGRCIDKSLEDVDTRIMPGWHVNLCVALVAW